MPLNTVELNNELWFKISNHDTMRPFFMTIASDSNHWMFISSNGGLTAGRKDSNFALFPYYTDDKITESAHITGSKSIFQVLQNGEKHIWEPFSALSKSRYRIQRNLFKNRFGNKILFQEVNLDLNLTFSYEWNSSNLFGFIRKATLKNNGEESRQITVLDGIQNILPYGVGSDFQNKSSNLVDAYKRSELVKESGLGIYALSAIIVDRAEPSEALKANVVWSMGLKNAVHLLSSTQLDKFRKGSTITEETDVKAEKGAYFVQSELSLSAEESANWIMVANVNQSHTDIVKLNESIEKSIELEKRVIEDVERGTQNLIRLVAEADGLQLSSDLLSDTRHFANTLFNIMRGGIFDNDYIIEQKDFSKYIKRASTAVFKSNKSFLENLDGEIDLGDLRSAVKEVGDMDLERLTVEYLPLKFSRRHGDPSRPWNKFSINTRSEVDGSKILNYEGNWRDIFQNWEALVHSYPEFVEGMIYKFLNATTFDGYNPYRITKDGFDWEVVEPDDPWSFIGYWGDHQIIYLLKFLEFHHKYHPTDFRALLQKGNFVYANVPYRIKTYDDIVNDPKDTIVFDKKSDQSIRRNVLAKGADGALASSQIREIHRVNFMEKILATVLAKISNFIPEAGIWMNTQRPEWNDANNALVGNGVSMVTLYYLRRFLKFFESLLDESGNQRMAISKELGAFFGEIKEALKDHLHLLDSPINDSDRKDVTDALGNAGSTYRTKIYEKGFAGDVSEIQASEISEFIVVALQFLEHAIRANQRTDKLYHAYNLMHIKGGEISVSHLSEMLEGQVAALSSGYLTVNDSLDVLDAMRNSALYRADQNSFMLYPNKELPGFLEKNNIPESAIDKSELLKSLIESGDSRIVEKDLNGDYHFNGTFKNARDLKSALDALGESRNIDREEEERVLDIFESVFDHKSFTGRSGTFFGYEGLGSIYWHMVSKLHFAVLEICQRAEREGADLELRNRLAIHFDEIGKGIGVHKEPERYGAFPTDPYSHTPWHKGAQQPGMTGQVKEDVLVRFGELGVSVTDGKLHFQPFLLKKDAFSEGELQLEFSGRNDQNQSLSIPKNSIGFSCCTVPVTYLQSKEDAIEATFNDGSKKRFEGLSTDRETARMIFQRNGEVEHLTVHINSDRLR